MLKIDWRRADGAWLDCQSCRCCEVGTDKKVRIDAVRSGISIGVERRKEEREERTSLSNKETLRMQRSTTRSTGTEGASLAQSRTMAALRPIWENLLQLTRPSRMSLLTSLTTVMSWR